MYADQAADPPDPNFGTVAQPVYRDVAALGPRSSTPSTRRWTASVRSAWPCSTATSATRVLATPGTPTPRCRQLRAAGDLAGRQADELEATAAALRSWAAVAARRRALRRPADVGRARRGRGRPRTGPHRRLLGRGARPAAHARLLGSPRSRSSGPSSPATSTAVPADTTYADALRQAADGMDAQVRGLQRLRPRAARRRRPDRGGERQPRADRRRPVRGRDLRTVATTVTLSGADTDGDPLTYAIVQQPAHGTLGGAGAARTYTSTAGFTGTDTFTYTVSDGTASSTPATVTITVGPRSNTAPTAYNASLVTRAGRTAHGGAGRHRPRGRPPHLRRRATTARRAERHRPGPDVHARTRLRRDRRLRFRVSDGELSSSAAVVSIWSLPHVAPHDDDLQSRPGRGGRRPHERRLDDAADGDLRAPPPTTGQSPAAPWAAAPTVRSAGYTGTDTFSYVARDQAGHTATAHVQVEVVEAPAGTFRAEWHSTTARPRSRARPWTSWSRPTTTARARSSCRRATDPPHGIGELLGRRHLSLHPGLRVSRATTASPTHSPTTTRRPGRASTSSSPRPGPGSTSASPGDRPSRTAPVTRSPRASPPGGGSPSHPRRRCRRTRSRRSPDPPGQPDASGPHAVVERVRGLAHPAGRRTSGHRTSRSGPGARSPRQPHHPTGAPAATADQPGHRRRRARADPGRHQGLRVLPPLAPRRR